MASTSIPIEGIPIEVEVLEEPVEKPARKFPPPCWTQEETLCLIEAYCERWYALRRGYLRTADWDAVAETVNSRCSGASPPKTSAQCRHKMEKLRQRYRAEKKRVVSYPYPAGRYFSSWFFFDNMEAMENGTSPPTAVHKAEHTTGGSQLKSYVDHSMLKLKVKPTELIPDLAFVNEVKAKRFGSGETKVPNDYSSYLDMDSVDQQSEDMPLINFKKRKPINPIGSKHKNPVRTFNSYEDNGGFHQDMPPPGLRAKKFGKMEQRSDFEQEQGVFNGGFLGKFNSFGHSRGVVMNNDKRSKRERSGLEEMVASIKYLGEGFMRMERAKMEMAQEMEAVRMEMEMKRNEMLLESQKQMVDAFVKGLFEMKKNKKEKMDSAQS